MAFEVFDKCATVHGKPRSLSVRISKDGIITIKSPAGLHFVNGDCDDRFVILFWDQELHSFVIKPCGGDSFALGTIFTYHCLSSTYGYFSATSFLRHIGLYGKSMTLPAIWDAKAQHLVVLVKPQ